MTEFTGRLNFQDLVREYLHLDPVLACRIFNEQLPGPDSAAQVGMGVHNLVVRALSTYLVVRANDGMTLLCGYP